MGLVFIDYETRSFADLKNVGAWVYSEHDTTDIFCLAYKTENMKAAGLWVPGDEIPECLLDKNAVYVARNALFEYALTHNVAINKYGFPKRMTDINNWICTAAYAAAVALPRSLEKCAEVLKVDTQKMAVGNYLINTYSKPAKNRKTKELYFKTLEGGDLVDMHEYCKADVMADSQCYDIMAKQNNNVIERDTFLLDFKQNVEGLTIDLKTTKKLIVKLGELQKVAENRMKELGCNVRSVPQMKELFASRGLPIPNVQAATVDKLLNRGVKDDLLKELLQIRQFLSKASVKKFAAMEARTSSDGKLRYWLRYMGAHTGRWSSTGAQLHNMAKSGTTGKEINAAIKQIDNITDPLDYVNEAKKILPGLITTPPGETFIIGDFAGIEARALAYFAGVPSLLKQFANNEDIYKHMAAAIFNTSYKKVTKEQRGVGKVTVLASGYGMGTNKYMDTCAKFGIPMTETLARKAVYGYRETYHEIPAYWSAIEQAFYTCIKNRKDAKRVDLGKGVYVRAKNRYIAVGMPSGREIFYHQVKASADGLSYWSHGKGARNYIYGGLLIENLIQAICRDIFADRMLELDKHGLNPVLHTHDEAACQVKSKTAKKSQKAFDVIMNTAPAWVPGFPLKTESEVSKRYHK